MSMIKTAALALTVLAATAGAASAAQYAWADQDAKVRLFHQNGAPTVNFIEEGQKVKIVDSFGSWYKIQIPGKDGWVKSSTLDFAPFPANDFDDASFCVGDVNAQFCINANF